MPLYTYKCSNEQCNEEFEEIVSLADFDTKEVVCPKCGTKSERKIDAQRATHTTWKHWRL